MGIRIKLHLFEIKKVIFTYKKVVNIHIAYEINLWPFTVGDNFALGNCLFGVGKLTKNTTDFYKYKYFGYVVGLVFRYQMVVRLGKTS